MEASRIGILRPLRLRDFRLLWIGTTVSLVGDGIFLVAIAWHVYDLTHSPASLAIVGVAQTVPIVLLLLAAGVLADRMDRRYLMIAGDLLRFAAVGAMALMAFNGTLTVPKIVMLAVVVGTGQALYMPSFSSIVPVVVPEDLLVEASSLSELIRPVAMILVGPFVGGVIIGVAGTGWAFAVDALSFAWSASMIAMMHHRHERPDEASAPLQDLREGLKFVRTTKWFWVCLVASGVGVLLTLGAWEILLPFLVKEDLHASAVALGLVYAAGGLASVVTAAAMGQQGRLPRRPLTVYYVLWVISCAAQVGFAAAFHVWQIALIGVVVQACVSAFTVLWFTMEYRLVPAEILGRVSSIDWLVVVAGAPLSYALIGPLVHLMGARATLVVTGLLGAFALAIPLFIRGALDPERDGSFLEPVVAEPLDVGAIVTVG